MKLKVKATHSNNYQQVAAASFFSELFRFILIANTVKFFNGILKQNNLNSQKYTVGTVRIDGTQNKNWSRKLALIISW